MKCPEYSSEVNNGSCSTPRSECPERMRPCRRGWITFWTPAERAGLKAMGRRLLVAIHYKVPATVVLESAIKEYVQAARKVKEGK